MEPPTPPGEGLGLLTSKVQLAVSSAPTSASHSTASPAVVPLVVHIAVQPEGHRVAVLEALAGYGNDVTPAAVIFIQLDDAGDHQIIEVVRFPSVCRRRCRQ